MILKASQRGGARQLARHLLRTDENDHVEVASIRGFVSSDLLGALSEAEAVARGTRCKQFLFSLSLNPPLDSGATPDDLLAAIARAEKALGLSGQPRVVVFHEKRNRLHAHAVWSRIDPVTLTAVPMSFFKTRLAAISKDLFLEHGWELPKGHRENGWKSPDSFSLGEWQQAKRLDLDPRELKQLFRDAWARSDDLGSFRQALSAKGYFLARGDRRGFVAVDVQGEVFSVARMVGIKTRELEARLGSPDGLPSVAAMKAELEARVGNNVRAVMQEARRADSLELAPLRTDRRVRVAHQRRERARPLRTIRRAPSETRTKRAHHRAPPPVIRPLIVPSFLSSRPAASPPVAPSPATVQPAHAGEPSLFIRNQRPDENFDDYMAYRRACFRIIDRQLAERALTQRKIEDVLAAQRARRMTLISRMAQLLQYPTRGHRRGIHP